MYEHDGRLYLNITLAVRNKGAQYGSIRAINGSIFEPGTGEISNFHWVAFVRSDNIGAKGTEYRPLAAIEELAEVLVMPARSIVTKRIQFITENKIELRPGDYTLALFVFEGLKKKPSFKTRATLSMPSDIVTKLKDVRVDKDSHISKTTVVIPIQQQV